MASFLRPDGWQPEAEFLNVLWSPEIDIKELIPPVYVARWAGTIILFIFGSWPP
jgi:hypothetical protein